MAQLLRAALRHENPTGGTGVRLERRSRLCWSRARSRETLVLLARQHSSFDQIKRRLVHRRSGHAHRAWACDSRPAENSARVAEAARSPGNRELALMLGVAILIRQTNSRSCVRPVEGVSVASGHRESSCVRQDAADPVPHFFTVRNSGPSFEMFPRPRNSMEPRNSIGVPPLAQ